MAFDDWLSWSESVAYFGVLLQLAVAGVVLRLRRPDAATLAFVAFVSLNAAWDFFASVTVLEHPSSAPIAEATVETLAVLTTGAAAALVAAIIRPAARGLRKAILAITLLATAYALLFEPSSPPVSPRNLWFPVVAAGAYLMARRGDRSLAWALLVYPVASGGILVVQPAAFLEFRSGAWLNLAGIIMSLGVAVWLVAQQGPKIAWLPMGLATLGVASTLGSSLLASLAGGVAVTAFALLLAYGLLHDNLLHLDLKVKFGIQRGTVVAIVVAGFVVAQEVVGEFVSDQAGLAAGAITTAALVLAIVPLQRLGQRLSDAALPDVEDTQDYLARRKHELYAAAWRAANDDGEVTDKEASMLAALQDELGLSRRQALAIERSA